MKNRKKVLRRIIISSILISLAFLIVPQLVIKDWDNLSTAYSERMLILYYSFSILGAIGTCLAVVIALFSEEIKKWLYKPNVSIVLKDVHGIEEKVDQDQQTPVADSYSCVVELSNEGYVVAEQSKVRIIDIQYGNSKDRLKSIKNWMGAKSIGKSFNLSVDYPYEMRLINIKNPDSYGTPSDAQTETKPLISFFGINIDDKFRAKGLWKLDYCYVSQNGGSQKFSIMVEWDGVMTSRKTEMLEHIKITKQ